MMKDFIVANPANHHIKIGNDRKTSYKVYADFLTKLQEIYKSLRDAAAIKIYAKPFDGLAPDERKNIETLYPVHISHVETE